MTEDPRSTRQHLIEARQSSYEHFDRTVLALSGGALALSLTFIDKITGRTMIIAPDLLFYAWISWGSSLAAVLSSHYLSGKALTRAIRDLDSGKRSSTPGGWLSRLTEAANALGGVLFLVGVLLMVSFAARNMETFAMVTEHGGTPSPGLEPTDTPTGSGDHWDGPSSPSSPEERGYTPPPDPPEAPAGDEAEE